jgi:hypothetical protein
MIQKSGENMTTILHKDQVIRTCPILYGSSCPFLRIYSQLNVVFYACCLTGTKNTKHQNDLITPLKDDLITWSSEKKTQRLANSPLLGITSNILFSASNWPNSTRKEAS